MSNRAADSAGIRKRQLAEANKRYYEKRRAALVARLGGRCAYKDSNCFGELQFDHRNGNRGWSMKELGPLQRLKLMEAEAGEGLLQLACKYHNGRKQDSDVEDRSLEMELRGDVPF